MKNIAIAILFVFVLVGCQLSPEVEETRSQPQSETTVVHEITVSEERSPISPRELEARFQPILLDYPTRPQIDNRFMGLSEGPQPSSIDELMGLTMDIQLALESETPAFPQMPTFVVESANVRSLCTVSLEDSQFRGDGSDMAEVEWSDDWQTVVYFVPSDSIWLHYYVRGVGHEYQHPVDAENFIVVRFSPEYCSAQGILAWAGMNLEEAQTWVTQNQSWFEANPNSTLNTELI